MHILAYLFVIVFLASSTVSAAGFDELFQAGQTAYKSGDFAKATSLLRQAGDELHRKKDSRAPLLWGNAAIAAIQAKDFQTAADLYEQILALKNPPKEQLSQYYSNLVHSRGELKQPALQIDAIERQLKAIPRMSPEKLAETYARLGDAYRDMEIYRAAANAYDKAAHVLPKNAKPEQRAKLLVALGLCQRYTGDFANAEKSLLQARDLAGKLGQDISIAEADSNLAGLKVDQGDYPEAIRLYQAAIEREKKASLRLNEGSDWNNLGVARRSAGDYAQAMSHINEAITIAREVDNTLGEAIALQNRALGYRIAGQYEDARKDYAAAIKLYDKAGERLGRGTAMMGTGRMAELVDRDYGQALEDYTEALKIFQELELPRWEATANLYLGHLNKRIAAPGRATRDLVFEEEPANPQLSSAEAIDRAKEFYAKSLQTGESLGSRELIWESLQGLGFVDYQKGNLEEALKNYIKAIDIVTAMHVGAEDAQILGEFMAGREDLYREAMEICAALYDKTGDKKYLNLQIKYGDTLKNDVQKASMALANLKFENPEKQKLFDKLQYLARARAKAANAVPAIKEEADNVTAEAKKINQLTSDAVKQQNATIQKLDGEYEKVMSEWKKKYPSDARIFDSAARIDLQTIQNNLKDGQALVQYVMLPDKLLINLVTNKGVSHVINNETSRKDLEDLIKDRLIVKYIEKGIGRDADINLSKEKAYIEESNAIFSELYSKLIKPIEDNLHDVNRIYISADGYLAAIPFQALVSGIDANGTPHYFIEDKEVAYLRPSFINQAITKTKKQGKLKKLLAVANPHNQNFPMLDLSGAVKEVHQANLAIKVDNNEKDIAYEKGDSISAEDIPHLPKDAIKPTETWLREKLSKDNYEILYLATHGMPFSDTFTIKTQIEKAKKQGRNIKEPFATQYKMVTENLKERTPLNGFLFLSGVEGDDVNVKTVPLDRDGLWTIKEIMELDDNKLKNTQYVILSACNTGVTFVPKSIMKKTESESIADQDAHAVEKDRVASGLLPGVDQVSFVEGFMQKGVNNVYGTFWFADDESSNILMSKFMQNLADAKENHDAVAALSKAQKDYVIEAKNGGIKHSAFDLPHHPFLWAVGGMFGK